MISKRAWTLILVCGCLLGCRAKQEGNSQEVKKSSADQAAISPVDGAVPSDRLSAKKDSAKIDEKTLSDKLPRSKKMVLIVVDTLRADRLGSYGYKKQPTSPHMDKLAAEGVLFEHFAVASPWTAPSFGTMLTGLPPTMHRAGKILPKTAKVGQKVLGVRVSGLNKSVPTLPELISPANSGAITNNAFLHPALGYARGFGSYDHKNASLLRCRRADEVTDAAVSWLKEHRDEDFFLLVHYFDPHISYDPPAKYKEMFAPGKVGRIQAPFSDHYPARNGELKPSEAEKDFIRGLYNAEVRFVDDQIGVLVDQMKSLGLMDSTWIALTSDHGEEQFDHGSFDHGHRYEEEVTRVPFILRAPQGKWNAGKRVLYLARHVDILPTVLDLFGAEAPTYLVGRSMISLIDGSEASHRSAYMEYNLYWGQKYALYDGRYKYIANVYSGRGYMYDLKKDPAEQHQLGVEHPQFEVLKKQSQLLRDNFTKRASSNIASDEVVELPEEVEKSLRSLGYIQ